MFTDLLYSIVEQEDTNNQWRCRIALNAQHIIFRAHFPEKAILPGACIVEIGKELLSNKLNVDLILQEAKSVKFLHVIEPQYNSILDFLFHIQPEAERLISTVTVQYNSIIFSKLTLIFKQPAIHS
jgi:3-hydroxyacyl-[acyl-carrier-protein] dehydratase